MKVFSVTLNDYDPEFIGTFSTLEKAQVTVYDKDVYAFNGIIIYEHDLDSLINENTPYTIFRRSKP